MSSPDPLRRRVPLAVLALAGAGLATAPWIDRPAPAPRVGLTVLAAASLTDAFDDLATAFEAAHPHVDVTLSTAGSQTLATQIRHGLPADVFASADAHHLLALRDEGLVDRPHTLVHNRLVLVSPAPATPPPLPDLGGAERLVIAHGEVPAGRYTTALFDAAARRWGPGWRAAVDASVVSAEPHVRRVATKVALGEADVAVVYATDATAIPGLTVRPLPDDLAPRATYLTATLAAAPRSDLARAWLAFSTGPEGRRILASHGFDLPEAPGPLASGPEAEAPTLAAPAP